MAEDYKMIMLEPHEVYIVEETDFSGLNSVGMRLFLYNVKNSDKVGLGFVRESPEILKSRFKTSESKFELYWLNAQDVNESKKAIFADGLEHIKRVSLAFAEEQKENGVIYSDALTYLVQHNGFEKVIRSVKNKFYDLAKIHGTTVIFSIRPDTFDSKELANLEVYLKKL